MREKSRDAHRPWRIVRFVPNPVCRGPGPLPVSFDHETTEEFILPSWRGVGGVARGSIGKGTQNPTGRLIHRPGTVGDSGNRGKRWGKAGNPAAWELEGDSRRLGDPSLHFPGDLEGAIALGDFPVGKMPTTLFPGFPVIPRNSGFSQEVPANRLRPLKESGLIAFRDFIHHRNG